MDIDPLFAPLHADLIYELETQGFREREEGVWLGSVAHGEGKSWPIQIDMRSAHACYPTFPPQVTRTDGASLTWHQNRDGSMCLYSQTQPGHFPWFRRGDLLSKTVEWLVQADAGWADESSPDLDLERYWKPSSRFKLIVHSPLGGLSTGAQLRFQRGAAPGTLFQAGIPHLSAKPTKKPRNVYGLLADIGELSLPPRNWAELRTLLPNVAQIESSVGSGRARPILVRYSRAGYSGVMGLDVAVGPGGLSARSISCAEHSEAVTALRSGPHAEVLAAKHITIVGVGAVGSFITEGLFRSGARKLTLIDGDRLRPGNMVRHAASSDYVGFTKGEAMARTLDTEHRSIRHSPDPVFTIDQARTIVQAADLVIDATANDVTTTLLSEAAREARTQILIAYLANQGRSRVATLHPSPHGEDIAVRDMEPLVQDGIEAGCGDPVSPTPPYAVQEIAAMACRKTIELLLHGAAHPEVQEYP